MGVFDDKKFEELDWISQTTEPIDSELNEILEKLPNELNITFDKYVKIIKKGYGLDIGLNSILAFLMEENSVEYHQLGRQKFEELMKCFKFESTGLDLQLNFETKSIDGGTIKFVKIATTLDEKVLENILGREGVSAVSGMGWIPPSGLSRTNEIMELLGGCEVGLKTRAFRKKKQELVNRLITLFKNNEWNIKDTTLADKVGYWIADYIKEGNLAALSNFCRLKVMTHKGQAIYSMEEVE